MKRTIKLVVFFITLILFFNILSGCKRNTVILNWNLPAFYTKETEENKPTIEWNNLVQNPEIKYILLYIWAKSDPPPQYFWLNFLDLDLFMFDNKKNGLAILGININKSFTPISQALSFFEENHHILNYPLLWDQKGIIKTQYGTGLTPTCILINQKREIVLKRSIYNLNSLKFIKRQIQEILNKKENPIFDA